MIPLAAAAVMGAGTMLQAYGQYKASLDQADAEERNAGWYREQAAFARESGERQRMVFDRESKILFGEQLSAFAKAGVDTAQSAQFMAQQYLYRAQEDYAIDREADFNERLATLRADQAEETAYSLRANAPMTFLGGFMQGSGQFLSATGGGK